jgi:hypothetical protein
MLETETKTFEDRLPELIKTDVGKFVLIKDDKVVGTYSAIQDALKDGYEKFKGQAFLFVRLFPCNSP